MATEQATHPTYLDEALEIAGQLVQLYRRSGLTLEEVTARFPEGMMSEAALRRYFTAEQTPDVLELCEFLDALGIDRLDGIRFVLGLDERETRTTGDLMDHVEAALRPTPDDGHREEAARTRLVTATANVGYHLKPGTPVHVVYDLIEAAQAVARHETKRDVRDAAQGLICGLWNVDAPEDRWPSSATPTGS